MAVSKRPLSVTDAIGIAQKALDAYPLTLTGEVSEVSNKPGYKAVYFTVKDSKSSLPCMMWMKRFEKMGVELRVGMLVRLSGKFSIYAAKGRMQFTVVDLAAAGEGDLRLKVAALARKLDAEGLTDPARKRKIAPYAETIGLVTSPRGAAVHDVLRTLRRRFPVARVMLAGVPVEGKDAPALLIEGLDTLVRSGAEVILLVRGGGSFEDLMPFNDEALARAIVACPVPVVTGIGHEPDNSIADMVADLRASTPTAAAEAISPKREGLSVGFDNAGRRLRTALERTIADRRVLLEAYADRPVFRDTEALFSSEAQDLDALALRMERVADAIVPHRSMQVESSAERLARAIPYNLQRDASSLDSHRASLQRAGRGLLDGYRRQSDGQRTALARAATSNLLRRDAAIEERRRSLASQGRTLLAPYESSIALAASRLEDLSPLAVIARGYAMVRDAEGSVVSAVDDVEIGQHVAVTVSDGRLDCTVNGIDQLIGSVDLEEE